MQDALRELSEYWTSLGCLTWQPFNTEVGAGTMNPATVLRVLGPEPWDVAYVEPSVRPDDSRYGENPNRLQTHTQFQVILKPEPGDPQELYLGSLEALGIDLAAHDVRFVEDNWQQPAIGAWGLGWEVWLDGMEITQFTYFQQVGGQNLDPIPVELTYGMERIMMALQGVTHFKEIVYAVTPDGESVTYGEAFGQQEYEMSRYYLDEADVEANRRLYETYLAEATRMVEARLPVPAHNYVLKSSHAFNVLDARGAISTTERAKAFGAMRRLARDVSVLWVERRSELGFPLLRQDDASPVEVPAVDPATLPATPQTLAFEIGVEELPPHVVAQTVDAVRDALATKLAATRLAHGEITVDGTPRRIVATVADVAPEEPDALQHRKGPKWAAAFDEAGEPTRALQGFLRGQQASVDQVVKAEIGGAEVAAVAYTEKGRPAVEVLAGVLADVVAGLRAEKNMRWCDPDLSFSRAIRWIVALWGPVVVPFAVSRLVAGRTTYLQRPTASDEGGRRGEILIGHVSIDSADDLLPTLAAGAIDVSTAQRRASVVSQAESLAAGVGGVVDVVGDAAVVDEVTNLVEDPHGVIGGFAARYLDLPDRILTTVMRKHQRYLPVRDAQGTLLPHFVTMANGDCDDAIVRAGNESVLRARYEDALFFWNADLQHTGAEDFVPGLEKLTFEDRLGSVGQRARRIADVSLRLADRVGVTTAERATLTRAGELAKFDLATQLVVEMSSLAGFVAREYAVRLGETREVADALYEMEEPHTSSDPLPASLPGALLALGDRFDLLASMFALGAKPTGSSDPFGLRRAALGVVRILRDRGGLTLTDGLTAAAERLQEQGLDVAADTVEAAREFTIGRFAQLLRDEGVPAGLVQVVIGGADDPGRAAAVLAEVRAASGESFRDLVAALVRIARILPEGTDAAYDATRLTDPAEVALHAEVEALPAAAGETLGGFQAATGRLVPAIHRFFDETLVMADDPAVRAARLGLIATILDRAPEGIDWRALDLALG
ncbi:glycine--tRNA ligase [Propionicicella superfundia]|uniref:glycine--tRNA ligase n=1 Tax=Propionicicella superfundia TaxID=348582 RepID=UPI00146AF5AF|nr:glycine--tRNA ligase [Propionicicella superfundia]